MNEQRITALGALTNILLAGVKLTIGTVSGSRALVADGVHSLSDLVTDATVFLGIQAAEKPADETHSFGHGRYETISALFVGLVLGAAGVGVGVDAVRTIVDAVRGTFPNRPGPVAAVVAAVSILTKEILYRVTYRAGVTTGSPAVTANAWHHRTDALSSLAAFVGITAAAFFGPQWRIMDPAAALVVAILVVYVGGHTVWFALQEMTDAALPANIRREIVQEVRSVEGVNDPHNLKTRRLGTTVAVEIHIRVDGSITVDAGHHIATEVEKQIKVKFGSNTRVITHVEPIVTRTGVLREDLEQRVDNLRTRERTDLLHD